MNFASDNVHAAHPAVIEALVRANSGAAKSYGADHVTDQARAAIRELLEAPEAEVRFEATSVADLYPQPRFGSDDAGEAGPQLQVDTERAHLSLEDGRAFDVELTREEARCHFDHGDFAPELLHAPSGFEAEQAPARHDYVGRAPGLPCNPLGIFDRPIRHDVL